MGIPGREEREKSRKDITEAIKTGNFPRLKTDTIQIQ